MGGAEPTPTPADAAEAYRSAALVDSYENALPASTQLVLGTLLLEGTGNAVTAEQAAALLPLWRALQGGNVQAGAEVNAVLAQIERAMTAEQLQAIASMQLTRDDLTAWAQESGMEMAAPPDGTGAGPGGQGGEGFSPEARETMRAELESMSPEEMEQRRAEMRATAEAGGMAFPEGEGGFGPGGGGAGSGRAGADRAGVGQFGFLLQPLIELLTERAEA